MTLAQSKPLAQDPTVLQDVVAQLAPCLYFQTMAPDILRGVLQEGALIEAPEGTVLIREGDTDDAFYILLQGTLLVRSAGREILRLTSLGDIIGEMAIISSAPRSADVVAAEPSRLLRVAFSEINAGGAAPERVRQLFEVFSHILAAKLNETSARAKRYEEAVHAVEQMESSQTRMESEIQSQLQQIALYSRVIQNSHDAVIIANPQGVIQRCNPAARRLFPTLAGPQGAQGQLVEALAAEFDRGDYPLPVPQQFWEGEWSRGAEDDPFVLHVSAIPIGHDGTFSGLALQCRDITLLKAQERFLERMVEERTREVRGLLDNMDEGILTVSAEGTIYPGYSAATERMIGHGPAEALLAERLGLSDPQRDVMHSTFALLLDPNVMLDWEDLARMMPSEFEPEPDRWLRARYRPVRGEDGGPVERIMVILQDITGEKALAEDVEEAHERQQRIVRILQDRENFELFRADALRLLEEAQETLRELTTAQRSEVDALFRTLHTLKGTGALFGLNEFAQAAHDGEDILRVMREHRGDSITEDVRARLQGYLEQLERLLRDAWEEVRRLLGEEENTERAVTLGESRLAAICAQATAAVPPQHAGALRGALARLRRVPTPRLLRRYRTAVEGIAEGLGKQVEFGIEDPKACELEPDFFQLVHPALLHLVRNAVDHGIESPEERVEAGKTPVAHIVISAVPEEGSLTLTISDDGRGIDAARVLEVGIERGFVKPPERAASLTQDQILSLLFVPGFSLAKQVTDISGRGVGLDVVKTEVERLGGRLQLRTRLGKGTTFRLFYPLGSLAGGAG